MSISISVILYSFRIKKKSGKFPVKLRVTINRVTKYYPTIFDLSEEDYLKLSAPRINGRLQVIRNSLQTLKMEAENFINDKAPDGFVEIERDFLDGNKLLRIRKFKHPEINLTSNEFDITPFLKRFKIFAEDHSKAGVISKIYAIYIQKLLQQGRTGSAINYQRSYSSLKKFRGNSLFTEINVDYLYQYEQLMLSKNNSKSTVSTVLRCLRCIFNEAIEMKIIKREKCYPFGRRRYQIPTTRNIKKALDIADVKKIYYYEPVSELEKYAKMLWLFCYMANGMNVKDMMNLKNKNIDGDYLVFERAKTERAMRADPKLITVFITEELKNIINEIGIESPGPNQYIFPIMRAGLTQLEQFDLLNHVRVKINDGMAQIAGKLGIDKKVTNIVSRHTFSTQLKRSGASTEYIQEALGHSDKRTTEKYLDSFSKEIKKEFAGYLTPFTKKKSRQVNFK